MVSCHKVRSLTCAGLKAIVSLAVIAPIFVRFLDEKREKLNNKNAEIEKNIYKI